MDAHGGYELIDFGEGARLERFGSRVVARPYPGAYGQPSARAAWAKADLRFERDIGWVPEGTPEPWDITIESVTLQLRPTNTGQLGLFPEHAAMVPWLRERIAERPGTPVLHLFAYTGLITLGMATAGAAVTHVDASRPTVAWARRNAGVSGLSDRPIRWIVDDALAFTQREARRGHTFGGVVLDPPTYGHGGNRAWRASKDLATLLDTCRAVLEPDGFMLLSSHAPELGSDQLRGLLANTLGRPERTVKSGVLDVRTRTGRSLELGAFAAWSPSAS